MQPTSEYPQLPPPGQAGYPVVSPYGYAVGQPLPPPAMPPSGGRSAGYWIGLTAAITAAIILALLGGFFIGRGTRLANDTVQSKITQQSQVDQLAAQRALNDQRTELLASERKAVTGARAAALKSGLRQGRVEGRQQGFREGQTQGYAAGQSTGYSQGQNDGYQDGVSTGACLSSYLAC